MANLITEIYDKEAVVANLNELAQLIKNTMNGIVSDMPKIQSVTEATMAIENATKADRAFVQVQDEKKKVLSDLDKLYKQADKALAEMGNLEDAEYQTQTKLLSSTKEQIKEKKQLLEQERLRQDTMRNSNKLLQEQATTEGELRKQQADLIKRSQSLRLTNAEENAVREKLIKKINENKEALKGMTNEVSKQKDNVGNYVSAWDMVVSGQLDLRRAMKLTRDELASLEAMQESGVQLSEEQAKRYRELNLAMGAMSDLQGDIAARTKVLADDYRQMTFAMEGIKLGVNIMTSLQAITALVGDKNEELAKVMAKIVAVQQILNTVSQIQKSLNKDSVIMTNLRIIATRDLATATKRQVVETKAAAAAQKVLNGVMSATGGVVAVAIGAVMLAYSKLKEYFEGIFAFQKEINEKVAEGSAEAISNFKILQVQFKELRTEGEKTQWIQDNADKFKELGLNINDVNDAEMALIKNADKFIKAERLKAEASAYRAKITEITKQQLELEMEMEMAQKQYQERMSGNAAGWERDIMNSFAKSYEDTQFADQGKDLADQLDFVMKKLLDAENELAKLNETTTTTAATEDINATITELQKSLAKGSITIKQYNKEIKTLYENGKITKEMYDSLVKSTNNYTKAVKDSSKAAKEYNIAEVQITQKKVNIYNDLANMMADVFSRNNYQSQMSFLKTQSELLSQYKNGKISLSQYNEEVAKVTAEYEKMALQNYLNQLKTEINLLKEDTDEWRKKSIAIAETQKKIDEFGVSFKETAEQQKATLEEKTKSTAEIAGSLFEVYSSVADIALSKIDNLTTAYSKNVTAHQELVNKVITDEQHKAAELRKIDEEQVAFEEEQAKKRAQIERRQAIFNAGLAATRATAETVVSIGKLLGKEAEKGLVGYVSAITAGISAMATIVTLIQQIASVPAYEKGGIAQGGKAFIAGEKGQEIGFGLNSGKAYMFNSPAFYKTPEPVRIHNATETRNIITNNNKDVTLHSSMNIKVVNDKRVEKYFRIGK